MPLLDAVVILIVSGSHGEQLLLSISSVMAVPSIQWSGSIMCIIVVLVFLLFTPILKRKVKGGKKEGRERRRIFYIRRN